MVTTVGEINKRAERLRGLNFGVSQNISSTTGTVKSNSSYIELDGTENTVAATLAAPRKGQWLIVTCTNASNNCTLTLTVGDFDGTNNVATFNAAEETLVLFGINATRFIIIENIGSVSLGT